MFSSANPEPDSPALGLVEDALKMPFTGAQAVKAAPTVDGQDVQLNGYISAAGWRAHAQQELSTCWCRCPQEHPCPVDKRMQHTGRAPRGNTQAEQVQPALHMECADKAAMLRHSVLC
jgi:hypothetical protein